MEQNILVLLTQAEEHSCNSKFQSNHTNPCMLLKSKIYYDRLENQFLDTLNGTDREIYLMRKQGLTQAEIAERLGYKTHSAVTKRMEKMRKALIDFCADFDN